MLIFEIVDRMGKVRATYCLWEDAQEAILTEYKGCKIREVKIGGTK